MLKKIVIRLANAGILNNRLFNNVLILLRLDDRFARYINTYNYKNDSDRTKSLQEIAGYSQRPEMNELLGYLHHELKRYADLLPAGARVLDIGCGPGLFLQDFDPELNLEGIDITPGMIKIASEQLPGAKFYLGDFISTSFEGKYDLVYSVGTLMYISKSKVKLFCLKAGDLLNKGGILFISYPHAISQKDIYVPDLTYIQYSPEFLERLAGSDFEILEHARAVDRVKVGKFDREPFINPVNSAFKTYQNSSVLILKKR